MKSKAVAGVAHLPPEMKLAELTKHLSELPELQGDKAGQLSTAIINLGIELSYIKQKEVAKVITDVVICTMKPKRNVIEACRKVGKPVMSTEMIEQITSEDDVDTGINREQAEEILLQDDFDSSRNNDDIDDAEVHEIIGNSSVSCDNHLE